jgi:hypothetical protein
MRRFLFILWYWFQGISFHKRRSKRRAVQLQFIVFYPHINLHLKGYTMVITATQQVVASIQPVDKKGNPARVDGAPVWAGDDALLTVVPEADGLSATIIAKGPLGHAQVVVTADADLGEGIVPLTGVLEVDIVGGQAVSLSIATAEPTEQA